MYIITNRKIRDEHGLAKFGKEPNAAGPNELRLLEVNDADLSDIKLLEDELSVSEKDNLKTKFKIELDVQKPWYRSLEVACNLFDQARRQKKHILLFVHGYNNDVGDVLKTARELQKKYKVLVVPFTWPANGGGPLSGTAAYLSDKEDARVSATALSRTVDKIGHYHALLTAGLRADLSKKVKAKHPENSDAARALLNRMLSKECSVNISLLCHSMGNYVFKHASIPSHSALRTLIFDNIAMVAADVNNPGHSQWLHNIPTRNRLYVVINENDGALKWSRRKPGEEQLARLGHYLKNLDADNAYYIDVTRNRGVRDDHSYFKGSVVNQNATVKKLFSQIFEGEDAEKSLDYHPDLNVYRS
ncbi:MAG: alpha/beta hydrolase [Pseudomonadota bacterium]